MKEQFRYEKKIENFSVSVYFGALKALKLTQNEQVYFKTAEV